MGQFNMRKTGKTKALYAGSFDPITRGQRFTIVSILEDDDAVAIGWTWSATHAGDMAGFAPTGARLTMSGLTIYDFDAENRIRGHWQIADRLSVFQQLAQNAKAK